MEFRKMSLARLRKAVEWLKKHFVELQRRTKTKGKSESAWARRRAKVVRRVGGEPLRWCPSEPRPQAGEQQSGAAAERIKSRGASRSGVVLRRSA